MKDFKNNTVTNMNPIIAVFAFSDICRNIFYPSYNREATISKKDNKIVPLHAHLVPLLEVGVNLKELEKKNHIRFALSVLAFLVFAAIIAYLSITSFSLDLNNLFSFAIELIVASGTIEFGFALYKLLAKNKDAIFNNLILINYHLPDCGYSDEKMESCVNQLDVFLKNYKYYCPHEFIIESSKFCKGKIGYQDKLRKLVLDAENDKSFFQSDGFIKALIIELLEIASAVVTIFMKEESTVGFYAKEIVLLIVTVFAFALGGIIIASKRFSEGKGKLELAFSLIGYLDGDNSLAPVVEKNSPMRVEASISEDAQTDIKTSSNEKTPN